MEIKARSEKRSSVITDLACVLILLIKEKGCSASALDIGNVQPQQARNGCLESMSHAPKAFTFLFGIPNYLYVNP